MKLCKDIRLGEKVSGKRFELTWKLKHNRPSGSIYVVVLPEVVPENLMEICAYEELRRKKQYGRTVIAAAANKSEAIEVVRALIEEMYQKTAAAKRINPISTRRIMPIIFNIVSKIPNIVLLFKAS